MPKNTLPRSRRASAPNNPKTKRTTVERKNRPKTFGPYAKTAAQNLSHIRMNIQATTAKPKPKADFVTLTELRCVVELQNMAADLAVEIRRRIENGARVQRGSYGATVPGGPPSVATARRHRENCTGTSLSGLNISHPEAAHASD